MDDSDGDRNLHLFVFLRGPTRQSDIMWINSSGQVANSKNVFNSNVLFQVAHLALLSNFPFFSVSSPAFVMAVVMVLVNHYFAFSHFGEKYYPFSEVKK